MNTRFEPLLDFELFHAFYGSEPCTDIDVVPTPACRESLKDQGMLCRKTKRGFTLLYEIEPGVQGTKRGPRRPLVGDEKFSFAFKSVNPYFLNYSELPLASPGQGIYYMHNFTGHQNGRTLLSANTSGLFLSAMDFIELRPQFFLLELEAAPPECRIEIRNEFNKTVIQEKIRIETGRFEYRMDLRKMRPGYFLLWTDGVERLRFYADDRLYRDPPIGVIDLFSPPQAPVGSRLIEPDGSIGKRKFTVHIQRRHVYWKYWIILKYQTGFKAADMSITYPDESILFERGEATTLPESLKAVPFVSNRKIPLQKKPIKGIRFMVKKAGGGHSFMVENLPNASFESLLPDARGGLCSEVYIYI